MTHQIDDPTQTNLEGIPDELRPFATKVLQAMNAAVDAGNKRLHGQLAKIITAISTMYAVEVWPFWAAESKVLAAEWNDLRAATLQTLTDQQADFQPVEGEDQTAQGSAADATSQEAMEPAHENQSEADQESIDAPVKPKREYRKIEYVEGQNPFRAGSKNARIWDLLLEGGHTREELGSLSGADDKSVGYILWLVRRSGIKLHVDQETGEIRLDYLRR
jgi:hypothetical protein